MTTHAVDIPLAGLNLTLETVLWASAAALVTAVVARYAAKAVTRLGHRATGIPADLTLQAARVARYFVIIFGTGVVLAILGAPIQPVLAATLLVLAAAFLMVRGIADNFGAGLVIQTRHPVRLGDLVESGGHCGHVVDLNSRSVVLATPDGRAVHLPNHRFMDSTLINLSARGRIRSEVQVRTRTKQEPLAVGEALSDLANGVHGVLPSPAPHALLTAAELDRLTFTLRFWHAPDAGPEVAARVTAAVLEHANGTGEPTAAVWPVPPAFPPIPPTGPSTP